MLGSKSILDHLRSTLRIDSTSSITKDKRFSIEEVECLGQCCNAPCMMINQKIYGNLTPETIESIIADLKTDGI